MMSLSLDSSPKVIALSEAMGVDEFGVVGRLHKVWSWAKRTNRDGRVAFRKSHNNVTRDIDVTPRDSRVTGCDSHKSRVTGHKMIDRLVRADGFAEALEDVGWLVVEADGLFFPNWEEWNTTTAQAEAKKEDAAERKRRQRERERIAQKERVASPAGPEESDPSRNGHNNVTRESRVTVTPETETDRRVQNTPPPTPASSGAEKAGGGGNPPEEENAGSVGGNVLPGSYKILHVADNPRLFADAKRIVAHYADRLEVRGHGTHKAHLAVMNLLDALVPEAMLLRATEAYAVVRQRNGWRPFGPCSFFEGEWEQYRNGIPKANVAPPREQYVPKSAPKLTPEQEAAARERLARLRAAPPSGGSNGVTVTTRTPPFVTQNGTAVANGHAATSDLVGTPPERPGGAKTAKEMASKGQED